MNWPKTLFRQPRYIYAVFRLTKKLRYEFNILNRDGTLLLVIINLLSDPPLNICRCNLGGRLSLLAPWSRLRPLISFGYLFRVSDFSSCPKWLLRMEIPMGNRLLPPEVNRRLPRDYLGDRRVGCLRLRVIIWTPRSWQRESGKSWPRHPPVGEILGVPDAIFLPVFFFLSFGFWTQDFIVKSPIVAWH